MVRLSRLADYAVVVMAHFAQKPDRVFSGAEVASELLLPAPTVSKLLKKLSRAGLLSSQRGVHGGYTLTRTPEHISIGEVVRAVEGPVALTDCIDDAVGECDRIGFCQTHRNWQVINQVVREALDRVSLDEMAMPSLLGLEGYTGRRGRVSGALAEAHSDSD